MQHSSCTFRTFRQVNWNRDTFCKLEIELEDLMLWLYKQERPRLTGEGGLSQIKEGIKRTFAPRPLCSSVVIPERAEMKRGVLECRAEQMALTSQTLESFRTFWRRFRFSLEVLL